MINTGTNIPIKVVDDPKTARSAGYTKNHMTVEMYCVGKWRIVGFYTVKQIQAKKWEAEARNKCLVNAKITNPIFIMQ